MPVPPTRTNPATTASPATARATVTRQRRRVPVWRSVDDVGDGAGITTSTEMTVAARTIQAVVPGACPRSLDIGDDSDNGESGCGR